MAQWKSAALPRFLGPFYRLIKRHLAPVYGAMLFSEQSFQLPTMSETQVEVSHSAGYPISRIMNWASIVPTVVNVVSFDTCIPLVGVEPNPGPNRQKDYRGEPRDKKASRRKPTPEESHYNLSSRQKAMLAAKQQQTIEPNPGPFHTCPHCFTSFYSLPELPYFQPRNRLRDITCFLGGRTGDFVTSFVHAFGAYHADYEGQAQFTCKAWLAYRGKMYEAESLYTWTSKLGSRVDCLLQLRTQVRNDHPDLGKDLTRYGIEPNPGPDFETAAEWCGMTTALCGVDAPHAHAAPRQAQPRDERPPVPPGHNQFQERRARRAGWVYWCTRALREVRGCPARHTHPHEERVVRPPPLILGPVDDVLEQIEVVEDFALVPPPLIRQRGDEGRPQARERPVVAEALAAVPARVVRIAIRPDPNQVVPIPADRYPVLRHSLATVALSADRFRILRALPGLDAVEHDVTIEFGEAHSLESDGHLVLRRGEYRWWDPDQNLEPYLHNIGPMEENCMVCMDPLNDEVANLLCVCRAGARRGAIGHRRCFINALRVSFRCPLCRTPPQRQANFGVIPVLPPVAAAPPPVVPPALPAPVAVLAPQPQPFMGNPGVLVRFARYAAPVAGVPVVAPIVLAPAPLPVVVAPPLGQPLQFDPVPPPPGPPGGPPYTPAQLIALALPAEDRRYRPNPPLLERGMRPMINPRDPPGDPDLGKSVGRYGTRKVTLFMRLLNNATPDLWWSPVRDLVRLFVAHQDLVRHNGGTTEIVDEILKASALRVETLSLCGLKFWRSQRGEGALHLLEELGLTHFREIEVYPVLVRDLLRKPVVMQRVLVTADGHVNSGATAGILQAALDHVCVRRADASLELLPQVWNRVVFENSVQFVINQCFIRDTRNALGVPNRPGKLPFRLLGQPSTSPRAGPFSGSGPASAR